MVDYLPLLFCHVNLNFWRSKSWRLNKVEINIPVKEYILLDIIENYEILQDLCS